MTAETDLLPLPDWMECLGEVSAADIRDYARANVAHATAAKDAEIEALRAEVEMLRGKVDEAVVELLCRKARAERLAEALREIADQGPHYGPDGTYKTWRHWAEIARAALEQEEGHEQ